MSGKISAKTGNATIKKFGQTAGNQYGTDNKTKVLGRRPPRDQSA